MEGGQRILPLSICRPGNNVRRPRIEFVCGVNKGYVGGLCIVLRSPYSFEATECSGKDIGGDKYIGDSE